MKWLIAPVYLYWEWPDGRWPMFGGIMETDAGIIVKMGSFSLSTSIRAVAMKEE